MTLVAADQGVAVVEQAHAPTIELEPAPRLGVRDRGAQPGRFERQPALQHMHQHPAVMLAVARVVDFEYQAPRVAFVLVIGERDLRAFAAVHQATIPLKVPALLMVRHWQRGSVDGGITRPICTQVCS